jgi:tetratricopeptide (TPR) repeat protein
MDLQRSGCVLNVMTMRQRAPDCTPNAFRQSTTFRVCGLFLVILLMAGLATNGETQDSVDSIVSALRGQRYDEALAGADSALKSNPRDSRIWTLKGIALSREGKLSAALTAFQTALAISPDNMGTLRAEASTLYDAGDKRAIPVLQQIIKADPSDKTAHEMLAVTEAKKDLCSAALSQFQLLDEVLGSHPESLQWYGSCLTHEKRFAEAIAIFERLMKLLPDQTDPRYDLALTQTMAGRNVDAIQTLQPLLSSNSADSDVLSLAAEAYEATGDTPKAVSLLRQAIGLDPGNTDLYVRFAGLCLSHDSFQVGVDAVNAGLQRAPNNAGLYIVRGLLYGQLEQYEKADKDFQTADQLNPADITASHALAANEIESGDLEAAQTAIERKLTDHPNDASLHFTLAKILIARGAKSGSPDFHRAMNSALLAIHLDPTLTPARDLLAGMYLESGQNSLAAQQCGIALKTNPSDQTALYHLIEASRKTGQQAEVQALVKRLLTLQQNNPSQGSTQKRYKIIEQNQASQ